MTTSDDQKRLFDRIHHLEDSLYRARLTVMILGGVILGILLNLDHIIIK